MEKVKLVVLISKLDNVSGEFFRDYYENHHVPLVKRIMPMELVLDYRRNYVDHNRSHPPGTVADFDVVTELSFASEENHDRFFSFMAQPHIKWQIRDDERHFLATSKIRTFTVREAT